MRQPVQHVQSREAGPDDCHVPGIVTFHVSGPGIGPFHRCSISLSTPRGTAPRDADDPGSSGQLEPTVGGAKVAAADRATVREMYRCEASLSLPQAEEWLPHT